MLTTAPAAVVKLKGIARIPATEAVKYLVIPSCGNRRGDSVSVNESGVREECSGYRLAEQDWASMCVAQLGSSTPICR